MLMVMGATGHVGGAVVRALLTDGHEVGAIVRNPADAQLLAQSGVVLVKADIDDSTSLAAALRRGRRAFLLNPPAPPDGDTDAREIETGRAIAKAAAEAGLEKIVVASTYGAQPGTGKGDLTSLWAFEQEIATTGIPAAINRGAYYFTNFDMLLDEAREGRITTMFPADFPLAMVAPEDLGKAAAKRLVSGPDDVGVAYVEGPRRHTFRQVADAFARALGHPVDVCTLPEAKWEASFRALGFSPEAARSYAGMTRAAQGFEAPPLETVQRGTIALDDYLERLVARPG